MQVIFKWIAQALLLPLLRELGQYLADKYKKYIETKRLKEENKQKGKAYESAPASTANDDFSQLP